jgi:hypothetical protein
MKHRRSKEEAAQDAARREGARAETMHENADVARGQAEAVLGFLGRMQLRLDVLSREQSEALARIEERLAALEHRLPPSAHVSGPAYTSELDPLAPLAPVEGAPPGL